MRELFDGAPTNFECSNAVTQFEALRAGVGLGVVHDFIARRFKDLVHILPERRAARAYWLVTHEDTRGLGRIRAVAEHLAKAVARDRGMCLPSPHSPSLDGRSCERPMAGEGPEVRGPRRKARWRAPDPSSGPSGRLLPQGEKGRHFDAFALEYAFPSSATGDGARWSNVK